MATNETDKQSEFDVFISFSSLDQSIADEVLAGLEAQGIRCWIASRDINPAENWSGSIMRQIRTLDVFLLILTEHSNRSKQVLSEVTLADKYERKIVCFRVDSVDLSDSLEYHLSSIQWVSAVGKSTRGRVPLLATAIQKILPRGSATNFPPSPEREPIPTQEVKSEPDRKLNESNQNGSEKATVYITPYIDLAWVILPALLLYLAISYTDLGKGIFNSPDVDTLAQMTKQMRSERVKAYDSLNQNGKTASNKLDSTLASNEARLARLKEGLSHTNTIQKKANKQFNEEIPKTKDTVGNANPSKDNRIYKESEVYKKPVFPGGEEDLMDHMRTELRYSDQAHRIRKSDYVVVFFVVNTDGNIEGVKVIARNGYKLGKQEAINLAKEMPLWYPGELVDGRKVRTEKTFVVRSIND